MFHYYKVIHKYKLDNEDEMKEIGVFSSQERALEAIDKVKSKPGFAEYQDGFTIEKFFKLSKHNIFTECLSANLKSFSKFILY